MKQINPSSMPSPRGYNNGMLSFTGKILFVAGQIGWDEHGALPTGLVAQFERAIQNVLEVVRSAGAHPENIGRLTIYLKDKQEYQSSRKEIGEAYRKHMGKHFPAMSLVMVHDLLEDGALVEIEATAVMP